MPKKIETGSAKHSRLLLIYFLASIVILGSFFAYALAIPLWLIGRVWPQAIELGGRVLRVGVRVLLRVQPWFIADVEVNLQRGGLTMSNHRSHLDVFLLLSEIVNLKTVCKAELFRVPFLSPVMRCMGHIPIQGGDVTSYLQAMESARIALRKGDAVHIFPEMTRCQPGLQGTQDFHLMPFHLAREEGIAITPIVCAGSDGVWPRGVFGLSYGHKVFVRSLPPIRPEEFLSADAMAREARCRIESQLKEYDRSNRNLHPCI